MKQKHTFYKSVICEIVLSINNNMHQISVKKNKNSSGSKEHNTVWFS